MRVVVIGSGVAGLSAARRLAEGGHEVSVLDKGRRPGGRLATREFPGGAAADHGAQFFTARSAPFKTEVDSWLLDGSVREWCRGFTSDDGHPRYVAPGGMSRLAAGMATGLDVRQSVRVDGLTRSSARWAVSWSARHAGSAGSIEADAVVLSAPVPQSARLLAGHAEVPRLTYQPTICLLVALDRPPSIPAPGGVQIEGHPTWSWVADNVAKGVSRLPAATFHTRPDLAAERFEDDPVRLTTDLTAAARSWLGSAEILHVEVHRWRYAIPDAPYPERCLATADGRIVLAGDAFGGPRVEGAFLSGVAAARAVTREAP